MYLDRGRVQRHGFELDADDLLDLQLFEDPVQNASLGPPAHPHIDRVPTPKTFRQTPPFAALFRHIQYCVHHLQVAEAHVPTLHRQRFLDPFILRFCQFIGKNNLTET
jgi:hypothetical protein